MARHSADRMARLCVRVPRGHQGFWQIIRRHAGEAWTVSDIHGETSVHRSSVVDYVRRLVRAGIVEVAGERGSGGHRARLYRLVRDPGPEAPRLRRDGSEVPQGSGQERMWRAIKMMGDFTWRDLVAAASIEGQPVRAATAKSYLKHLQRAGYLIALEPGGPGKAARYRLRARMNTGPLAPMVQRTDWVWDPNLQQAMGPEAEA